MFNIPDEYKYINIFYIYNVLRENKVVPLTPEHVYLNLHNNSVNIFFFILDHVVRKIATVGRLTVKAQSNRNMRHNL